MKKTSFIKPLLIATVLFWLFTVTGSPAAVVDIEWQKPENFRDIKGGVENQKNFQERALETLTAVFEEGALKTLPSDQTLHLTITDVDLAGEVEYHYSDFPSGVRVMREMYYPSIELSYVLKDKNGEVIKSGEEKITDMSSLAAESFHPRYKSFDHEKRMINKWFSETFGG